jgi:DNA-binding NarL/FixJ family response regulator
MKQIKIAIVDDHDLFREGIRLVLGQIENFEVVFDTSSGILFLEFLQNSFPDVVLMDINMPVIDGVETTRKAIELNPNLNVIALTRDKRLYFKKIQQVRTSASHQYRKFRGKLLQPGNIAENGISIC